MVAVKHLIQSMRAGATSSSLLSSVESFSNVLAHCDIAGNVNTLQTALGVIDNKIVPPSNLTLNFVGLAYGVQNYTCTQGNNFTNVGAVAELYDVSCLANASTFQSLQMPLFQRWHQEENLSIQEIIETLHIVNPPEILAQHYSVQNPVTKQGVSPTWDFRSSGNSKFVGVDEAFIIAKGLANIPAPNAARDVAWLQVENIGGGVGGKVADQVLRTDTVGGQPPTSCEFGKSQDISVKYTSKYWFFGGELGGPQ